MLLPGLRRPPAPCLPHAEHPVRVRRLGRSSPVLDIYCAVKVPKRWMTQKSSANGFKERGNSVNNLQIRAKESATKKLVHRRETRIPGKVAGKHLREFAPSDASVLLGALAFFVLVAADVFAPRSPHLLSHIDSGVHSWVMHHIATDVRRSVFENWVSDVFIVPGLLALPTLSVSAILSSPRSGAIAAGLVWAFYPCGGVALVGDVWLVDGLKHFFHRLRPSTGHSTFAFPSGHTTAAVFLTGVALFVLLPTILPSDGGTTLQNGFWKWSKVQQRLSQAAPWVWALSGAVTAVGRIGADAHWVSDTLAGASLAVFLVSLLTQILESTNTSRR